MVLSHLKQRRSSESKAYRPLAVPWLSDVIIQLQFKMIQYYVWWPVQLMASSLAFCVLCALVSSEAKSLN